MVVWLLAQVLTLPAFTTGGDWLVQCQHSEAVCVGYAAGATDQFEFFQGVLGAKLLCLPETITSAEVMDLTTRFMLAHPEERSVSAATVIAEALRASYPCRPK